MLWVMDGLRQDHVNLSKLLDALERQLDVFDRGGAPDYDIIQGVVAYCLGYPDKYHHPKEDLVYDKLVERDPAAADAVGDLRADHRHLAKVTADFAAFVHDVLDEQQQVARDRFVAEGRAFLAAYRDHMTRENEVIFPIAEKRLAPEHWADIALRLQDPGDPLFGEDFDHRYHGLRRDILAWQRDAAS